MNLSDGAPCRTGSTRAPLSSDLRDFPLFALAEPKFCRGYPFGEGRLRDPAFQKFITLRGPFCLRVSGAVAPSAFAFGCSPTTRPLSRSQTSPARDHLLTATMRLSGDCSVKISIASGSLRVNAIGVLIFSATKLSPDYPTHHVVPTYIRFGTSIPSRSSTFTSTSSVRPHNPSRARRSSSSCSLIT